VEGTRFAVEEVFIGTRPLLLLLLLGVCLLGVGLLRVLIGCIIIIIGSAGFVGGYALSDLFINDSLHRGGDSWWCHFL
jgi:hypothetical protein